MYCIGLSIASIIFEGIVNRERVPNERLSFHRPAFSIQASLYISTRTLTFTNHGLPSV